jgi:hypothetical protein
MAETTIKMVAGIAGGIVILLQGINLKEVGDVSHANAEEMILINRVHEEITEALQKQAEMIELLKKQKP